MKKLKVPFKSQLDNWNNPFGSCNVTSVAMCLEFLGVQRKCAYSDYSQFEDELYSFCIDNSLDRHKPDHLAQLIRKYGANDRFTTAGTIPAIQDWIDLGLPCIIHGFFTNAGHIIVVCGYDERGLIVHDPYGEYFADGYRTDLSGEALHYSYGLIKRTCSPDGDFWVHFVSPGDSL